MSTLPNLLLAVALAALGFVIMTRGVRRTAAAVAALTCGALSLATTHQAGAADVVKPPMAGHWEGRGRIIVDWCKQEQLPLSLKITADGKVSGKIGDATLLDGKLTRNRGPIGRRRAEKRIPFAPPSSPRQSGPGCRRAEKQIHQ